MTDMTRMLDALEFARNFFEARAQMATPGSEGAGKLYECAKGCADAIVLLKAQEPVEPVIHCKNADLSNGAEFACSGCGGSFLHKAVNYCPWCGRTVKWDA